MTIARLLHMKQEENILNLSYKLLYSWASFFKKKVYIKYNAKKDKKGYFNFDIGVWFNKG